MRLKLKLTRFGGAPQAVAGGFSDAQNPSARIRLNSAASWSSWSAPAVIRMILPEFEPTGQSIRN